MKISNEILSSIDAIIDYLYSDECKDYIERISELNSELLINDKLPDEWIENPDNMPYKNHIFYHISIVSNFLNQ